MNTKYGEFEVRDNGKGGAILSIDKKDIVQFPKTSWWDMDGLLREVGKNGKLIEKRIKERIGKVEEKELKGEDCLK